MRKKLLRLRLQNGHTLWIIVHVQSVLYLVKAQFPLTVGITVAYGCWYMLHVEQLLFSITFQFGFKTTCQTFLHQIHVEKCQFWKESPIIYSICQQEIFKSICVHNGGFFITTESKL